MAKGFAKMCSLSHTIVPLYVIPVKPAPIILGSVLDFVVLLLVNPETSGLHCIPHGKPPPIFGTGFAAC